MKRKQADYFSCVISLLFFAILSLFFSPVHSLENFSDEYELFFSRPLLRPDSARNIAIEQAWTSYESSFSEWTITGGRSRQERMEEAHYRRAAGLFTDAVSIFRDFQRELRRLDGKRSVLDEGLWWKAIERSDRLNRDEQRIRREYNARIALSFQKVFEALDSITLEKIRESSAFVEMQKGSFRMFALSSFELGNHIAAISALERYQKHEETEIEWPFHYYLSRCYSREFAFARKTNSFSDEELRKLRRKRNLHFLRAVELKFGRKSEEFIYAGKTVRSSELGSPRDDAEF